MFRALKFTVASAVILSLISFTVHAQVGVSGRSGAPRGGNAVAAYVFGAENSANAEALAETVVDNLVRSGNYSAPRRGAREFFREADRAQARNRNRLLEDRDFCRIGSDFGIQYLCVIDIERAGRGNSVWARVLDLENCRVIATAEYTGFIRNTREIQTAANSLTGELVHRRVGRRSTAVAVAPEPSAPAAVQSTPAARQAQPATTPAAQGNQEVIVGQGGFATDIDAILSGVVGANRFIDPRDGQVYRTVRIGNLTWMGENLNFQTGNSWCYDNSVSNCAKYGRLYDWNTAMTACPAGWRLPTREDWDNLVQAAADDVAGTRLKASSPDWDGTDDYGFSALPGGSHTLNGVFRSVGNSGYWWSAAETGSGGLVWLRDMYSDNAGLYENSFNKGYGISVRCVQ